MLIFEDNFGVCKNSKAKVQCSCVFERKVIAEIILL